MFEQFPYTDMHQLNLDWIIKIAKDFLDQYTQIQDLISNGEESLQNLTTSGLEELQEKADGLETLLQEWYNTHSSDIANQLAAALQDLNAWYTLHQNYLDQTLTDKITAFNTAADQKAAEAIATIPSDYTALANKVTNNTIANTLQISISTNIKTWYFEPTATGVYIKLPGSWYIRAGKSKTFAYATDVFPNDHVTSTAGVADCIFVPLNNILMFNIATLGLEIVAFQTTPYDDKYVPIFKISVIPMYGASYCGITGGIGRYLFDSWQEYNNKTMILKNLAFSDPVFYVRANAKTNMYFESWIDGVYIYLNGVWYIRNAVENNKDWTDVLPLNRYTSYKGYANCIKLEPYKSLVFDTSDSTYKIIDFTTYTDETNAVADKYLHIFDTALIPFNGATLVDIVSGAGLGLYMKWLHYYQEVFEQDLYYYIGNDIAKTFHFNNRVLRNDGQDIAVYNGTIFSCDDDDCTVNGTTFSITDGHPNSVSFGSTLHGDYPYLYCKDFYTNKLYVNQVTDSTAALVDTINLEYAQYYSNAVVDEANSIIYAFILTTTHPEDNSDVYFCKYDMTGHRLSARNIGAFPVIQGMTLFDDKIYVLSGYGTNNGGALTIFNTTGDIIGKNALPFSNILEKQEPQGISVDPITHVLYIATRDYIIY